MHKYCASMLKARTYYGNNHCNYTSGDFCLKEYHIEYSIKFGFVSYAIKTYHCTDDIITAV